MSAESDDALRLCSVCDAQQGWADILFPALAFCGRHGMPGCITVRDFSWRQTQMRLKKVFDDMRWETKPLIYSLCLVYAPFAIRSSIDDHC